jgi:coenzyme F420-reducing hydrogenase alpha subunit
VEGHSNITVKIENGELKHARWEVVETPRYFEAILVGKRYTTVAMLVSRICGICSISHALTSLRTTEEAFGIEIPPAAAKLRLLAKHGETLQSHYLHLFFLAAPDFLGLPSVIPLLEIQPEVVHLARRLKGLANRLCDLVAGRTTHPVSLQIGGVARFPDRDRLLALRDELRGSLAYLEGTTADLVSSFDIPEFTRETEFVSLKGEADYPFIGGDLISSDGVERAEPDYLEMTNEYAVEESTSKMCKLSRGSFAVGALARFNNNHRWLNPRARLMAGRLGLEPVCHNPFMNNVAQLVECVHVTTEAIELIEELTDGANEETMAGVVPRAGEGVAAVEAPRGILYHHYEYDGAGRVVRANCVIPTTQNNANIQADLADLARQFATPEMTDERLELLCAMLVRAYDPCISCSVH